MCEFGTQAYLVRFDNDLMTSRNIDGGYTSGIRIETFGDLAGRATPIDELMDGIAGSGIGEPCVTDNAGGRGLHSWFIAQEIYTPAAIEVAEPQPDDRPWAGVLYVGRSWEAVGRRGGALAARRIEMGFGFVGDASLARQAQERIHRVTGSDTPKGWDSQLHNRVAAAVRVLERRRWGNDHADLVAHAGGMLGTLQGYAHAGATLRYGRFGCEIATPGVVSHVLRVSEAEGCQRASDAARYFGFIGIDVRAFAWNEVIDGKPRRGVSHVRSEHLAGELRAGFSYGVGRWTITYLMAWRRAEYSVSGMPHPPSVNYASIVLLYE
ncbi:lipid A deacylase LpxR family protein [Pseudomonas sp. CJQ_7]|uniref:lipid A deacylase LpxR family protein n=1 Tax=Pseudomonas sp. CJQ_7 TaxID=3367166 RepID=UPI00370AFCE2